MINRYQVSKEVLWVPFYGENEAIRIKILYLHYVASLRYSRSCKIYFVSRREQSWRQHVFRTKTLVTGRATCVFSHTIKKEHWWNLHLHIENASRSVCPYVGCCHVTVVLVKIQSIGGSQEFCVCYRDLDHNICELKIKIQGVNNKKGTLIAPSIWSFLKMIVHAIQSRVN